MKITDDDRFEGAPLWSTPATLVGYIILYVIGHVRDFFLRVGQKFNLLPTVEKNREVNNESKHVDYIDYTIVIRLKYNDRDMHRCIQTTTHSTQEIVTDSLVIVGIGPFALFREWKSSSKNAQPQIMDGLFSIYIQTVIYYYI